MPEIVPDIANVSALLRTRTKDDVGNETGVFSANTRPTLASATALLNKAKGIVVGKIGTSEPCTSELATDAAGVIEQRCALMIELSYFSEQINTNRSPYEQIKALYDQDLKDLIEAIAEQCGSGIGEPGTNGQLPSYDYGNAPILGKRTQF